MGRCAAGRATPVHPRLDISCTRWDGSARSPGPHGGRVVCVGDGELVQLPAKADDLTCYQEFMQIQLRQLDGGRWQIVASVHPQQLVRPRYRGRLLARQVRWRLHSRPCRCRIPKSSRTPSHVSGSSLARRPRKGVGACGPMSFARSRVKQPRRPDCARDKRPPWVRAGPRSHRDLKRTIRRLAARARPSFGSNRDASLVGRAGGGEQAFR
jgi:hypothetical protein